MSSSNYGVDPERPTANPGVLSADAEGHVDPAVEFVGDTAHPAGAAAFLRTTQAVRSRAAALLARARAGESEWFTIGNDDALEDTARTVAEVTRDRYAWGPIPYHSRWRHFEAGGVGLRALVTDRLGDAFQVSGVNPLVGLAGRATLLRRLGEAMHERPEVFGDDGRPGGLFDALIGPYGPAAPPTAEIAAHEILSLLLESLSGIWPAANAIDSIAADGSDAPGVLGSGDPALALGDCWRHRAVQGPGLTNGWMPFHKLSQWLSYSMLEPFEWAGVKVRHVEALTALPEYRNGGLLIDSGLIVPRSPAFLQRSWKVGDEFIVEWRALTVALLDEVAARVRRVMELSEAELPLARVLEGGTWAAGRVMAQRLREGAPPLRIESDGTVF